MPRRKHGRKHVTPLQIADLFCKFTWGKSTAQVVKEIWLDRKVPEEIDAEDLTEDMVHDSMEGLFGEDYYEDDEFVDDDLDDVFYDDPIYQPPPRRPRPQSAAAEYADFFRYQAEQARQKQRAQARAEDIVPEEMSVAEARKVLGVSRRASPKAIKKRFRRLAKKWHPDVCKEGVERGSEMFKRISLAYERLMCA